MIMNNNIDRDNDLYNIHTFGIDTKNRELYLHSHLDSEEEAGVEFHSAVLFQKNVRYLNTISRDPILVHMHLPGGVWEDCFGMFDTIKSSWSPITILAYAKVESASSVLLQAAHKRILMPNTHVLIHYGSLSIDNEHKAAMSSFVWSEQESQKMIDIFTEKCLASNIAETKKWKRMMVRKHITSQLANKSDWILNAQQAVEYGFADGVLGDKNYPDIDSLKILKKTKK
jgi:ATP-dependent protease ClpP protease subunit